MVSLKTVGRTLYRMTIGDLFWMTVGAIAGNPKESGITPERANPIFPVQESNEGLFTVLGHPIGEPASGSKDLSQLLHYAASQGYHPEGIFQAWNRGNEGYILLKGLEVQEKRWSLAWITGSDELPSIGDFQLFIPTDGLYSRFPPQVHQRTVPFQERRNLYTAFVHPSLEGAIQYALEAGLHLGKIQQTFSDASNGHINLKQGSEVKGAITSEVDNEGLGFRVYLQR